jgi:hypothetical protein
VADLLLWGSSGYLKEQELVQWFPSGLFLGDRLLVCFHMLGDLALGELLPSPPLLLSLESLLYLPPPPSLGRPLPSPSSDSTS